MSGTPASSKYTMMKERGNPLPPEAPHSTEGRAHDSAKTYTHLWDGRWSWIQQKVRNDWRGLQNLSLGELKKKKIYERLNKVWT